MMLLRSRRAIALLAALLLLGVMGLLIAGSITASTIADRASSLAQIDARLMTAADYVLNSAIADPERYRLADLPLGVATPVGIGAPDPALEAQLAVTRLPGGVLWLVTDVSAAAVDGAHRRVNLVAAFGAAAPVPPAAIVSAGDVRLGAGVTFAADTASDPECRSPAAPAIVVAPGATVANAGTAAVAIDAAAADSTTYALRASQRAALGGAIVTRTIGDTTISGGAFTGILVVNGNLTIAGPWTLTGMAVAAGRVVATARVVVQGALLAFAPAPGPASVQLDDALLAFAPCTVGALLRRAAPLRPVRERSWAELF